MYGSESWVWQKKNESRINVVEIRSSRSMSKDRCKNSDIRERCSLKEDVVTRVERGMLRCQLFPVSGFGAALRRSHVSKRSLRNCESLGYQSESRDWVTTVAANKTFVGRRS
ncbi:hypothetical protein EVAR_44740_1 [Eumeta japonica]|uniref:Uncharacterized protein n=1 Tax=Eumeta variegata TaxID=151549 RepID=A0A4C1XHC9_EUMVA|nr:hypothetical protein EVAR_44740_1 [Eumeta japonica]